MLTVMDDNVSESPVFMVTELVSAIDRPNVPLLTSDQQEMSVTTSPFVPAQLVHAGELDAAIDPADADPHVTDIRVVVLDTLEVPALPGVAGVQLHGPGTRSCRPRRSARGPRWSLKAPVIIWSAIPATTTVRGSRGTRCAGCPH